MKALITGASSGIGRDMARYLSKMGYDLVIVARRCDLLEELKQDLKTDVKIECMDLSSKENCEELFAANQEIDLLVNNAGFGDFGKFDDIAPYYLVTMLLHDQKNSIAEALQHLSDSLAMKGYAEHCLHTGPLIRKEEVYKLLTIDERKSILNCFVNFASKTVFQYVTFIVEKKEEFIHTLIQF